MELPFLSISFLNVTKYVEYCVDILFFLNYFIGTIRACCCVQPVSDTFVSWNIILIIILILLDLEKVGILMFHIFLPYVNLFLLRGRLTHVQRLGKKPIPRITYEQRELWVGQIVAQECY
jgi:hypothetical protein